VTWKNRNLLAKMVVGHVTVRGASLQIRLGALPDPGLWLSRGPATLRPDAVPWQPAAGRGRIGGLVQVHDQGRACDVVGEPAVNSVRRSARLGKG